MHLQRLSFSTDGSDYLIPGKVQVVGSRVDVCLSGGVHGVEIGCGDSEGSQPGRKLVLGSIVAQLFAVGSPRGNDN